MVETVKMIILTMSVAGIALCSFIVGSTGGAMAGGGLTPDMLAVQGHWIRVDAPYLIELSHSRDGLMRATYLNKRPDL